MAVRHNCDCGGDRFLCGFRPRLGRVDAGDRERHIWLPGPISLAGRGSERAGRPSWAVTGQALA